MRPRISGLGAWYPDQVRRNDAWPADFGEQARSAGDRTFNDIPRAVDEVERITTRYLIEEENDPFLGVVERRVAPATISAVDAEVFAAERALSDARLSSQDIDVVISYSVVPDRITPASAGAVADRLGISGALCWGMDAACATGLVQIATAAALVQSGQARNVLLTQSHLLLKTFPLLHPAAPGLGDAATAVVVGATGRLPIVQTVGQTHGQFHRAVTWIRGATDDTDQPWWQAGPELRVGSRDKDAAKALQRDTVTYGANTLRRLVKDAGVDMERVGLLASVEPRGWVPRAMSEVVGLDLRSVYSVYNTRGHLGACGPIANLEGAFRERRYDSGTLLALYAQGAGFTTAGVLLELDDSSD